MTWLSGSGPKDVQQRELTDDDLEREIPAPSEYLAAIEAHLDALRSKHGGDVPFSEAGSP